MINSSEKDCHIIFMTTGTILICTFAIFMHARTLWLTAKLTDVNVREIHQSLVKKTHASEHLKFMKSSYCQLQNVLHQNCHAISHSMKWPRYLTKVFVNNDDVIYRCIVHLSSWYFGPLCSTEKKREFNIRAVNGLSQHREGSLRVETPTPLRLLSKKQK